MMDFTVEQIEEYFQYLDDLRESGETNMFGAGAYLRDEYGFERRQAGNILTAWMATFSAEPVAARAQKATPSLAGVRP